MKIRLGFVSNSSSSSFVIGLGKVVDGPRFYSFLKKRGLLGEGTKLKLKLEYDYQGGLSTAGELRQRAAENQSGYGMRVKDGAIVDEAFTGTTVMLKLGELRDDDLMVFIHYSGGDDDNRFYQEDSEEYDYNVEPDGYEQKLLDLFKEELSGVHGDAAFGAGRNG